MDMQQWARVGLVSGLVAAALGAAACGDKAGGDTAGAEATVDGGVGGDGSAGSDGTDGGDGTDGTDGGDGTDGVCETLDVETCADRDDCGTIDGRPVATSADGRPCVDWEAAPVPLGCMSIDRGCDGALTMAADPADGSPWLFTSGCIPSGWEMLEWLGYVEC